MQKIITVYKPIGKTPLDMIQKVQDENPALQNEKISYAGRLDPLAHGVLILLAGDAITKKADYLNLQKEYTFEVVFGIQTDTYDMLGYLHEEKVKDLPRNVNLLVNTFVNNHIGKQIQSYPPYSSRTVAGKPLFWWARQNKLDEIEIPTRPIEIFSFTCVSFGKISLQSLQQRVIESIAKVKGDFRQEEIKHRWEALFTKNPNTILTTAKFTILCSSGTYVRSLANQLDNELGCGAIALDILRTAVGEYRLDSKYVDKQS